MGFNLAFKGLKLGAVFTTTCLLSLSRDIYESNPHPPISFLEIHFNIILTSKPRHLKLLPSHKPRVHVYSFPGMPNSTSISSFFTCRHNERTWGKVPKIHEVSHMNFSPSLSYFVRLEPKYFPSSPFSNTFTLCLSRNVKCQASHP